MEYTTTFDGKILLNGNINKELAKEINYIIKNNPSLEKPGTECRWHIINEENNFYLKWNGNKVFYDYIEWLEYIVKIFFQKQINANGIIIVIGEDFGDGYYIIIENNNIYLYSYMKRNFQIIDNLTNKELIDEFKNVYMTIREFEDKYWNHYYDEDWE